MTVIQSDPRLERVVAVANGKGGVGKTSTTAHVGALAAAKGYRVLLVDLDPQGNLAQDFGYTCAGCVRCTPGQPEAEPVALCDNGTGLSRAVQFGEVPPMMLGVRERLDIIPGGGALDDLAAVLGIRAGNGMAAQQAAKLALANTLAPVAAGYDLTLVDCPPQNPPLQAAALVAARYLLIPTKTDRSSLLGLGTLAQRFGEARALNPALTLLGVLVFGTTSAAKTARQDAKSWIDATLGGTGYVLSATVRHVETPATVIRAKGLLAHELETGPEAGVKTSVAKTMIGLAGDYEAVAAEVLTRLIAAEEKGSVAP